MTPPRFDFDDVQRHTPYSEPYRPATPHKSWWQAMPWVVRWAIVLTAVVTLLPVLALVVGGAALLALLQIGV
jgi:hypothetical protein